MRPQATAPLPATVPASPMLGKYLVADLPAAAALRPYLEQMDANRWYTNFGPLATSFERKLTALLAVSDPAPQDGAIHLTTISTCYHALETGLKLLTLPPGGKVLIPAITFPACPLAVQHAGFEPVLCDIDPVSWTLTPAIARAAAQRTQIAAVMPVAVYGIPLPADEWSAFTRDTGIPVIIDAAAAIENQAIPQSGLVAHSLHATKPFGVGEGGLLVSRDAGLIEQARIHSNFGTIDRMARGDGTNAKFSEYHAAVGLAQLERWPAIKQKRRALLDLYREHLAPLVYATTLHPEISKAVPSLLMLRMAEALDPDIAIRAKEQGLALHRTYLPPLYRHPYFANLTVVDGEGKILPGGAAYLPNAESMDAHVIGVPFHPFLEEDDIAAAVRLLAQLAGF